LELDVQFTPWQQEVFGDTTRFKVVAAGRRCGKSYLAAWSLLINALQSDDPRSWTFYVAPTQGQARQIMWRVLLDLGHSVIKKTHINNLDIELVNGQTIGLRGADRPDTMRGVSLNYLVLDEYADIKSEVWEEILRPACADKTAPAIFIGTPKGRNHFYDLFKYSELSEDEEWRSWHFTSYDNPFLKEAEIDAAKRSMSSYAFRQEFMASFESKGSEMFKEEWVKFAEEPTSEGDYYIAIDLAGFEEVGKRRSKNSRLDETAISVCKVCDNGDWFVENIIYGRWDLNETATKIFQAVRDYNPVSVGIERGIAKQAVMSPLMDLQKKYNKFFRVEELTHGNKKKTDRVMWALQGRFENGVITLQKGEWNARFLDQLFQFPDALTHDDLIDSLAYIDQLAQVPYGIGDLEFDEPELIDAIAGY
jgi:predicted phage terminase large subunit-like protein